MKSLKYHISNMALATAVAAIFSSPATAQSADEEAQSPADQIIVTGTRRTDRTAAESTAPIDVFSQRDLETQSSGDMNNVLRSLIPSFNVARFVGISSDGSSFVRPPTLRGLPPDQILVLINGKRRHRAALVAISGGGGLTSGSQGVDLAQIPTIAIERIEVLRDGAAAQYGSDAIAGVMNYTLRTNRTGLDLRARYGEFYKGDGQNSQIAGNLGLGLTERGFLNISAEYLRAKETTRNAQRPAAYATLEAMPDMELDDPVQKIGDPSVEAARVFVNGGIEFSNEANWYFFGNYGWNKSYTQFNWRNPYTVTGTAQNGVGTASYARTNVYNPIYLDQLADGTWDANGRTFSFTSVYPNGFTPYFGATIRDLSAATGLRGSFDSGLTYDLSANFGQNLMKYRIWNTLNASMGPDSPTSFNNGSLRERDMAANLDLAYPVDLGLASPITIAVGSEVRRDEYRITPGDAASYAVGLYSVQVLNDGRTVTQPTASNGFPGFAPSFATNSGRTSYAGYLDVEGDIFKGFTLGAAVRYDHFSDFGGTTNVKGSARYEFSPAIAIRGAASTGFRAPTVGQLFATAGTTGFQGSQPIENLVLPANNPAAQLYGGTNLKPEKSKNLSAGFVFTPEPAITITVDYYNIKVEDRIGTSTSFQITTAAQREELRAVGLPNWATVGTIRYFTNAFATRTQGVDMVMNHRLPLSIGNLTSTLAVNYNETKVTDRDPVIVNDERVGDIENLLPNWRATLTENFSTSGFNFMVRGTFFGPFEDYALAANGGNLKVGSEFVFDVEARYDINEHFSVAIGADNVFDQYPDKDIRSRGLSNSNWYETTNSTVSGSRYVDNSPFGYNGGFYYARITAKF